MTLRALTWCLSAALHAGALLFFMATPGGTAFESGSGDDQLVVEQGIAIEGFARLGDDQATVEEVEAPPMPVSEARPEIKEVKDLPDLTEVITSAEGPQQEILAEEPKELEEIKEKQVATLEQLEELAVREEESSGAALSGGDTTARSAYLGQLRSQLDKKKVNPRSREKGTVVVRFTVDAAGQVLSREVAASSGSKLLDEAAVASIDRASPFPPMPDGVAKNPLVVSVPFKFSVR
jgi:protein TonB